MKTQGKAKGYLLGAAAAASYGLNPTFALPLYADGMNPDSVLLFRYGFAIPIIAAMIVIRGRSFKVEKGSVLPLAVLGILMALSSLTLFMSYNHMAAGIASTILFVYPIMVAVIMSIFFKEKISMQTILCILLATSGILFLYRGADGQTLSLKGTSLAVGSALAYALYLVGVNNKRVSHLATLTVTFYVLCFGVLLFAGRLLLAGISAEGASNAAAGLTIPSRWYLWLDALALAALPTTVSLLCTTAAIQIIGSTPTAILGALEPVTAVIMGMLFFSEGMTGREAFGIAMILAAVSFVIAGGKDGGKVIARHLTRFRHLFPNLRRK